MIIAELEDDIAIRRVLNGESDRWRVPFTGAYQTIFAGHPYFERFSPIEAEGVYRTLTNTPGNVTLLATQGKDKVVGFGIGIPLVHKHSVASELNGLLPIKHTFYLAELGVLNEFRGRNIGRLLVRERLLLVDREQFSHVVLRVSTNNAPSAEMYRALGFENMGVYMEVTAMRTNGKVRSDRRFFLSRVLSQVELD